MTLSNIFAQDYTRHTVGKGETITQIAQKYKVTPYDIYKINPDAQKGIKEKDVILIPSANSIASAPQKSTVSGAATHTVKAKETLFSIAREYNTSVDELKKANPSANEGLKVGQVLSIPGRSSISHSQAPVVRSGKATTHIVESKETKFGIAKKYGLTVEELERQNPGIVKGLQVGYKLSINGNADAAVERPAPVTTQVQASSTTQTETSKSIKREGYANYEVKPKETMFSLTQMFNISEADLVRLNPNLKEGVKTGMILKVPGRGSMVFESPKTTDDLTKSISTKNRKKLVLLLPFNAERIQGDTLKSLSSRLKKEPFLNMTLDFYAGALMAIDSAKTLGMNIDVKIYDSRESKTSSAVGDIAKSNGLETADAVIGPFYQQHAEKLAELLNANNVPVISPLSKEDGKVYTNLFQAMPSEESMKKAMMDYLVSRNGNIIVVNDPKKASNREFITKNYPDAQLVQLSESGALVAENLKMLLQKDKMNYVIIDSEKTGMILSTTNVLLNEMANFQIQLAIIEPNETLDFEEISMKRITILKMLYPSQTRENNTPEAIAFENAYKKENKVFPSQYAIRGFDVTFDTMLRLSQGKSFEVSANEDSTEEVESKFRYEKKESGGYANKGVYILQYEEDLSVKEVK
jgi:LysM repeat protein/succinate dehydrogenase flavin-adding protein (antitoxin of CptAB toxin-antitoxin module)